MSGHEEAQERAQERVREQMRGQAEYKRVNRKRHKARRQERERKATELGFEGMAYGSGRFFKERAHRAMRHGQHQKAGLSHKFPAWLQKRKEALRQPGARRVISSPDPGQARDKNMFLVKNRGLAELSRHMAAQRKAGVPINQEVISRKAQGIVRYAKTGERLPGWEPGRPWTSAMQPAPAIQPQPRRPQPQLRRPQPPPRRPQPQPQPQRPVPVTQWADPLTKPITFEEWQQTQPSPEPFTIERTYATPGVGRPEQPLGRGHWGVDFPPGHPMGDPKRQLRPGVGRPGMSGIQPMLGQPERSEQPERPSNFMPLPRIGPRPRPRPGQPRPPRIGPGPMPRPRLPGQPGIPPMPGQPGRPGQPGQPGEQPRGPEEDFRRIEEGIEHAYREGVMSTEEYNRRKTKAREGIEAQFQDLRRRTVEGGFGQVATGAFRGELRDIEIGRIGKLARASWRIGRERDERHAEVARWRAEALPDAFEQFPHWPGQGSETEREQLRELRPGDPRFRELGPRIPPPEGLRRRRPRPERPSGPELPWWQSPEQPGHPGQAPEYGWTVGPDGRAIERPSPEVEALMREQNSIVHGMMQRGISVREILRKAPPGGWHPGLIKSLMRKQEDRGGRWGTRR